MKPIFIITIIVCAVVLVAGIFGYAWMTKQQPAQYNNKPVETNTPVVQSLLTVIDTNVQVKSVADAQFAEVKESANVGEGYQIKTSLTGRALLEAPGGTTTAIDKNSEVTIAEQSSNDQAKIQVQLGNVWASVQHIFNQGEHYQVQTPNAVATVRGTSFGVFYANHTTVVMVYQSSVWVVSIDPVTGQQIGSEVVVTAGQKATIEDGKAPVIFQITAKDKASEWYQFNIKKEPPQNSPDTKPQPAKPAACSKDSDCGASGFTATPFCQQGNVYQMKTSYVCNNPGTSNASCSSKTSAELKQACSATQSCQGGTCVDQPVACASNADCGTDGVINVFFCQQNGIYQNYQTFTCNSPGTARASCSHFLTSTKVRDCSANQSCVNGDCVDQQVPQLDSVSPAVVYQSQDIAAKITIAGKNLSNATAVMLNAIQIPFSITDSSTLSATLSSKVPQGVYDVSVTFSTGQTLTLPKALTVR